MPPTLEDQLDTIQTRLGETLEVFAIANAINERADPSVDPDLNKAINRLGGFWQASLLAYQTTLFMGINAILDKENGDSATLYSAMRALTATTPGILPVDLEQKLDTIRNRYKKLRHKLFGHNDMERQKYVDEFNASGFTWPSLESDLRELEYIFKILFEAVRGRAIPSVQDAPRLKFPYQAHVERAQRDIATLLGELLVSPRAQPDPLRQAP